MELTSNINECFRLVPSQKSALRKLGIETIGDMLRHLPVRYDRAGGESAIIGAEHGASVTILGTISKLETRRSWKRKIPVGEAVLTDNTGSIPIRWFHQPYMVKKFSEGMFVKAVGIISGTAGKTYLANPHTEVADPLEEGIFKDTSSKTNDSSLPELFAVYPESSGITSLWFRHAIEKVLTSGILKSIEDPIPLQVRKQYHLPDLATALVWIHKPEKESQATVARKRFAFEEIFTIQIIRAIERLENDEQPSLQVKDGEGYTKKFLATIHFPPTGAQHRAIDEIVKDMRRNHPMARLLEGDVGSGKTLVAAASAYAVVNSRPPSRESGTLQVAYMAPTEILAMQHFQSFIEYFKELPINIGLITGSGCKKFPSKVSRESATNISRAQLLKWVANGEIAMLIGTHAIIQESVKFQHLALAIVDEQHRFGTAQRRALAQKNTTERAGHAEISPEDCSSVASSAGRNFGMSRAPTPHFLSMTATPIPRTLALTIYGDLDLSVLDELPPGRAMITTKILKPKERQIAYESIHEQLRQGHQAYVICPRIEEPDPAKLNALQAKSAKAEAKRLQVEIFADYNVGLLHGAMKPSEKDAVMKDFEAHKIDVLVATSVVEVGINVPNATAILIEGAERFGLAQLHQLRGRIMRSSSPPVCFLLSESSSEISFKRLRALEKTNSGFVLAEADLASRGMGDLFGRRQWGISDIGMEALQNQRLIMVARTSAQSLVSDDPTLAKHSALQKRIAQMSERVHRE